MGWQTHLTILTTVLITIWALRLRDRVARLEDRIELVQGGFIAWARAAEHKIAEINATLNEGFDDNLAAHEALHERVKMLERDRVCRHPESGTSRKQLNQEDAI